jgi:hypothetical protein
MHAEIQELAGSSAIRQRLWFMELESISVGIAPACFSDALALASETQNAEMNQFAETIQVRRMLYDEFHTLRPA